MCIRDRAARVLREKKIGCLPVVEPSGRLVGILTHEDVLDFFLDITGCLAEGTTRIAAHLPDAIGQLGRFLTAINDAGGYIATVVSDVYKRQVLIRSQPSPVA